MHRQQDIDYYRVARGIDYITTHYRDAPELADIAAAAHLSPFHFQRLFTAWAGVSTKSFTRYLWALPMRATRCAMAGPVFWMRRLSVGCPAPGVCMTCSSALKA